MKISNPQLATISHQPAFDSSSSISYRSSSAYSPKGMPLLWARESGPVHGPYAEAWFDEFEQVHRVRLTAEGRAKVADYLSRYPHPIALLISTWPAAYRAARAARLSDEEIDSLCLEGVALAFARYDPTRGASIGTAVVWGIRASIGNAVRHARRASVLLALSPSSLVIREESGARRLNVFTNYEGRGTEDEQEVTHYLALPNLSDKERTVLTLRFGLANDPPLTSAAIALVMGLSTERVRQLQENAIRKIRKALGLDVDWFAAARSRITAYLSSFHSHTTDNIKDSRSTMRNGATKADICNRTGVPMWQLREVMSRLLQDGLVIRERKPISRARWCIVYRIRST
ncbi:MAG TPA: sigma-70 family RNA polymerase sigma factor [Gemmata sp.]|jgi:RNA polymerase sigma factor (sigma-70 family)|nr:sigma-70 family RNA polymerase sigma factor [Gemmata sp.]